MSDHKDITDAYPRLHLATNEVITQFSAPGPITDQLAGSVGAVFPGVGRLLIDGTILVGFVSADGEETLLLSAGVELAGNAGVWLRTAEEAMIEAVKGAVSAALENIAQTPEYIERHIGQAVLIANLVQWTRSTVAAISGGPEALKAHAELLAQQHAALIRLTSHTFTKPNAKYTVSNLIATETYHLEVVRRLVAEGVTELRDYTWKSQVRACVHENEVILCIHDETYPY
jgi:hypothetical protein